MDLLFIDQGDEQPRTLSSSENLSRNLRVSISSDCLVEMLAINQDDALQGDDEIQPKFCHIAGGTNPDHGPAQDWDRRGQLSSNTLNSSDIARRW